MNFVRPVGVLPDRADEQLDVHIFSPSEGLVTFESLDSSQFVEVLLHEFGKLVEVLAAFFPGTLRPQVYLKVFLAALTTELTSSDVPSETEVRRFPFAIGGGSVRTH